MADIKPTYTENHDHGLLISLVHRMIGAIDKGIGIRRAKKVALTGEIAAEENTKLLGLGIDINHAANYDAKVELLKEINKELFQLEKRRERLYMWIRYMKTLDNEVTLQNKNQAEYQQQQLALQQQQQQLYLQFLAALKEEMPSLLEDCRNIIDVLTREIKEHKEVIEAVQEVMNDVAEIHNDIDEMIKDIKKDEKEIEDKIAELEEKEKTAEPGSIYAQYLRDYRVSLELNKEDVHAIGVNVEEMAEDTSPDGQMAHDLRSRLHAEEENLHTTEKMVAEIENIKAQAQQMAELTPAEVAAQSGRLPAELNVQDLAAEFKKISGTLVAAQKEKTPVGISEAAASDSLKAASTGSYSASGAAQIKSLNAGSIKDKLHYLKAQRIIKQAARDELYRRFKTLDPRDEDGLQKIMAQKKTLDRELKDLREESAILLVNEKKMVAAIHSCLPQAAETTAAPLVIPASIRDATLSAAAQGQDLSGGAAILPGHALHNAHWPPLAKSVTDHGQSADPEQQSSPNAGPNKRS